MDPSAPAPPFRPDRRLGWALALSLAVHGLALTPALSPPGLKGSPPLQATLRRGAPAAPVPAPEAPAAARTVQPVALPPLPEPVEKTYGKAPAATAASAPPADGPRDSSGAASAPAQGDGAAVPAVDPPPPQAPRPAIDVHGLRQYHLALGRMAARFKRYPAPAREAGWEGRVVLRLSVSEGGVPLSLTLIGGSGVPVLDQAALEMMRLAASHTPVPESLAGRAFTIDLAVDYNLRDEP